MCEGPSCSGGDFAHAANVVVIAKFGEVTVLRAVGEDDILVLMGEVFAGFREAVGCVAGFEEGAVVAAADFGLLVFVSQFQRKDYGEVLTVTV